MMPSKDRLKKEEIWRNEEEEEERGREENEGEFEE